MGNLVTQKEELYGYWQGWEDIQEEEYEQGEHDQYGATIALLERDTPFARWVASRLEDQVLKDETKRREEEL